MDTGSVSEPTDAFIAAMAQAQDAESVWSALRQLSLSICRHTLFTVMTVDLGAGLARRAFTDNADAYPVSGTKPIQHNAWFDIVHGRKQTFVANTIAEIATVFPDYELIAALGCGSVVNLPVVLKGELAATINMLDAEWHWTPDRVAAAERHLMLPAMAATLAARQFDSATKSAD